MDLYERLSWGSQAVGSPGAPHVAVRDLLLMQSNQLAVTALAMDPSLLRTINLYYFHASGVMETPWIRDIRARAEEANPKIYMPHPDYLDAMVVAAAGDTYVSSPTAIKSVLTSLAETVKAVEGARRELGESAGEAVRADRSSMDQLLTTINSQIRGADRALGSGLDSR